VTYEQQARDHIATATIGQSNCTPAEGCQIRALQGIGLALLGILAELHEANCISSDAQPVRNHA
jgi:hypothetical protein